MCGTKSTPIAVNVTNTTSVDLYGCTVTAVPDTPRKIATISVGADWSNDRVPFATRVLRAGETTTVDVVIDLNTARSDVGILRFIEFTARPVRVRTPGHSGRLSRCATHVGHADPGAN
jgi:hypothetical protein